MTPERKRMIDSGISFHHPGVEEVEDIFITLTLMANQLHCSRGSLMTTMCFLFVF